MSSEASNLESPDDPIKYFCYDCVDPKTDESANFCWRAGHKLVIRGTDTPVNDPVNHPKHYTSDPSGVECITITRHRNFNIGNAMKYLWRAGLKDSDAHVQDLEKAIFYINDEIARLRNESSN